MVNRNKVSNLNVLGTSYCNLTYFRPFYSCQLLDYCLFSSNRVSALLYRATWLIIVWRNCKWLWIIQYYDQGVFVEDFRFLLILDCVTPFRNVSFVIFLRDRRHNSNVYAFVKQSLYFIWNIYGLFGHIRLFREVFLMLSMTTLVTQQFVLSGGIRIRRYRVRIPVGSI